MFDVTIVFKGGAVHVIRVKKFKVTHSGGAVTGLSWEHDFDSRKPDQIVFIDPSDVAAVFSKEV